METTAWLRPAMRLGSPSANFFQLCLVMKVLAGRQNHPYGLRGGETVLSPTLDDRSTLLVV